MEQVARTGDRGNAASLHSGGGALFRLAAVFIVAALALIGVFQAAGWYAERVSIPRYCGEPEATLRLVRETLSERRPAPDASTRPYIVAAKLIFLIPRNNGEPVENYLARLRVSIAESCA